MRPVEPPPWHIPVEDLHGYAAGTLAAPALWSAEAHLAACPACREALSGALEPGLVEAGWARVDAALDAPRPGPVERALLAVGVPDHTARLLVATPALRLSWLAAVAVTLALTALLANLVGAIVFLAAAPLLPLLGVAVSYGPGIDPTYELTLVAPLHSFRLLLLRCVAVVCANTLLCGLASLAIAGDGPAVAGWFLPSLALTVLTLALMPRLGPVAAASAVGVGWLALVGATGGAGSGRSVLFSLAGQVAVAAAGALAAAALARQVPAFDSSRLFRPTTARRPRP